MFAIMRSSMSLNPKFSTNTMPVHKFTQCTAHRFISLCIATKMIYHKISLILTRLTTPSTRTSLRSPVMANVIWIIGYSLLKLGAYYEIKHYFHF